MVTEIKPLSAWDRVEPTFSWVKHGVEVIGDRHLPNGRRQHIIKGSVPAGTVLDNADIFGEYEPSWCAQFADR